MFQNPFDWCKDNIGNLIGFIRYTREYLFTTIRIICPSPRDQTTKRIVVSCENRAYTGREKFKNEINR